MKYIFAFGILAAISFTAQANAQTQCKTTVDCAQVAVTIAAEVRAEEKDLREKLAAALHEIEELKAKERAPSVLHISDGKEATPRVKLRGGTDEGVWTCPADRPLMIGFGHGQGQNDFWAICAKEEIKKQ